MRSSWSVEAKANDVKEILDLCAQGLLYKIEQLPAEAKSKLPTNTDIKIRHASIQVKEALSNLAKHTDDLGDALEDIWSEDKC